MDKKFNRVFSEQAELYRASQVLLSYERPGLEPSDQILRSLRLVDDSIEAGVASLGPEGSLRPDAQVFLLTNLHQMVAMPLANPRSPTKLNRKIEDGLKSDAQRIISAAAEQSHRRHELTASDILKAVFLVIDELTLKSWRLWDSDE